MRLRNCLLIDGTGASPRREDVCIQDGRFVAACDGPVLDCRGLAVAPGFIDAHSHSDLAALRRPLEKVRQGVTAEVVGNCGFSAFPAIAPRAPLHEFANGILYGQGDWGWGSAREYLNSAAVSNTRIFSLVGHGTLRVAVAGNRQGPLSARELDRMEGLLDDALSAGAVGFSTGLMYAPGSSAPAAELARLSCVVGRRGKLYATHMRDYSGRLVEAVDEQIALARQAGCRLQISHLQAVGQRFWKLQRIALDHIEKAGIDIGFDCYPYLAGSTVLTLFLPQWVLDGGTDALLERLRGPERVRIARETEELLAQTWADIFVSAAASGRNVGRSIEEIARERACPPADTVLDLLLEEGGAVNVLEFNQSEANLRETLTHPLSIVISDGFYVSGRPHPRLAGTFPHLLGDIVRERGWMSLPEAVRKITSAPATRFGLADRGRIRPGCIADLVVFDPAAIGSPATFEAPELPPHGIHLVLREGMLQFSSSLLDTLDTPGGNPA
ncbi:MAG TPA: amidohydrolase family protein [Bryobacteraceae bacterium]|nr:amidohydrolase family protein [Bryobacteraceae bacterium]